VVAKKAQAVNVSEEKVTMAEMKTVKKSTRKSATKAP